MSQRANDRRPPQARGFTLVEILVVITIIGVLAGLLIPAIGYAVNQARTTAIKMEVDGLAQAVEAYNLKYGDYPPDFSRLDVVQRHFQRIFPQISNTDLTLIQSLCLDGDGEFDPTAINRAEALVLVLGGYSSDERNPFTGQGGPFERNGAVIQYNSDRDNALFNFDIARLTLANNSSGNLMSTDDGDALPIYLPEGREQPILYFDSRTYGIVGTDAGGNSVFNGYWDNVGTAGGVRPYKSAVAPKYPKPSGDPYGSLVKALDAYEFHNRNSFQIISAGLDDIYGNLVFDGQPGAMSGLGVYFIAETGSAVYPNVAAKSPAQNRFGTISKFQDGSYGSNAVHGQLDNVTNFSSSTLESDLVEESEFNDI